MTTPCASMRDRGADGVFHQPQAGRRRPIPSVPPPSSPRRALRGLHAAFSISARYSGSIDMPWVRRPIASVERQERHAFGLVDIHAGGGEQALAESVGGDAPRAVFQAGFRHCFNGAAGTLDDRFQRTFSLLRKSVISAGVEVVTSAPVLGHARAVPADHLDQGGVEFRHLFRAACRLVPARPGRCRIRSRTRPAGDGRQLRQHRHAGGARHRDRLQASGLHQRQGG